MIKDLIYIDESKCVVCYACIRVCPVKAIEVHPGEDFPVVMIDQCIGCGDCLGSCGSGAIRYHDSIAEAKALLEGDKDVVVLLDPALSAEFPDITDYRKLIRMIHEMGAKYVQDVSFGADLIGIDYKELASYSLGKFYLFSNCPPIVSLVEKYYPHLIDNLAPIINPMVASAKVARALYGNDCKVIFIGPCIGAKTEAQKHEDDGYVDAVLTFDEMRQMIEEKGLKETTVEYSEFDGPEGNKGHLYPISNGIIQASGISEELLSTKTITIDGGENAINTVKEFSTGIEFIKKHFNVFYCEGCMMGPGMSSKGQKNRRLRLVLDYAQKRMKKINQVKWQQDLNQFGSLNLECSFKADSQRHPEPPAEKVDEILKIIERDNQYADVGCKACGYNTCREFASAVAMGAARTEMCLMHSISSKQDYIKTLKVTNDKLGKTQQALVESEKRALNEKQLAQDALETTQTMLRKLPTAVVIVDEHLKVIGSNETFISILGEEAAEINEIIPGLIGADLKTLLPFQFYKLFSYVLTANEDVLGRDVHLGDKLLNVTIFSIKKEKIVGGVIRDLYMPEVRREEVISRVTEVIEQSLELVQQIGFLLGEGAAKTEKMLNSIIESHQGGKENK